MSRFDRIVRERKLGINHKASQDASDDAKPQMDKDETNHEAQETKNLTSLTPVTTQPTSIDKANSGESTNATDQKESVTQKFRLLPIESKTNIVSTALLVIANFALVSIAFMQSCTLNNQASLMREQSDSMAAQVRSMDEQLKIMKESLDQTKASGIEASEQANSLIATNKTQADAAGKSSIAAERSANIAQQALIIGQRPRITVGAVSLKLVEGELLEIDLKFVNQGNTPGRQSTVALTTNFRKPEEISSPCPEPKLGRVVGLPSKGTIPVNLLQNHPWRSLVPVTATDVAAIKEQRIVLFIWWKIEYSGDWKGGGYFTEYYARYNPTTDRFEVCPTHNDSN